MVNELEEKRKCPVCGSTSIVRDEVSGEVYCARCGTVIEELPLDFKPPPTYEEPIEYRKIRPSDTVVGDKEKKLLENFESQINNYAFRLKIPYYIKDTAVSYFAKILTSSKKILPENIKYIAAALLYIAAREHNYPLSYKAIKKTLRIPSEKIMRAIRAVYDTLHIKPKQLDPIVYLQQVIEKLKIMDSDTIQAARKLLKTAEERSLISGKDIRGVVGGVIYIVVKAHGIRKTQKEIAKACGITEVTIRNRFLELVDLFEELTGIRVELRKKTKKRHRIRVRI